MNSVADVWTNVLQQLKKDLSETTITTWFDELTAVDIRENTFYLHCPNDFKKRYIESLFIKNIKAALQDLFSMEFEVKILDEAGLLEFQGGAPKKNSDRFTYEDFTFETFVVGPSNKLAYAASMAVAEHPAQNYNPLLIYGDSGLGKTHLLYSIYHTIRQNHPDYQIIYIKGDEFTNELSEAIRLRSTDAFRQKYRDKDLLLVDDIQFIAGKEQTQEEFFNTFNNLYEAKKQIVLTSDRPPSDMLRLEDRLRTRFEWGLMADIQPPDYETRCAIIKNKSILLGLNLPSDIIEYIAQNITANVRQLEGTIKRLMAYRDLMGSEINDENASRAIRELIRNKDEFVPSPEVIVEETAKFYDLDPKTIMGESRKANIVLARQVSMYIIRSITNQSLPEVGKFFGQHHTTVMHSVEKIEKMLSTDRELKEVIRDIKANVNDRF